MRALLDVNVLIALFDEEHTANEVAHEWLEENCGHGIATCPLTENGLVRILSNPNYSSAFHFPPSHFVEVLENFVTGVDHEFWADEISLRDASIFNPNFMIGSKQITDLYLLGLAASNGGRLITFDKGINLGAVKGATSENLFVI